MRRAPVVVGATGAGLAALLSFHTTSLSGPTGPLVSAAGPGTGGSGTGPSPGTTRPSAAPAPTTPTTRTPSPTTPAATTPTPAAAPPTTRPPTTTTTQAARRADGTDVFYRYGELELQVTISGGRIADIQQVVDNATDPRSAQINDEAIPYLRQQALQAQSSNVDGVSGATYTSDAYVRSLQAALDKLGWKQ